MIVRHSKRCRRHAVRRVVSARRCENGTVLFVTMLITGIVGVLMLSYLSMVQTQNFSVSRAQAWNKAIVVAEAGVITGQVVGSARPHPGVDCPVGR